MPIISKHRAEYNISRTGRKKAPLTRRVLCPVCGRRMKVRDSRKRGSKAASGGEGEYQVRRYYCGHCNELRTELPSDLSTRMRYETDTIQDAIDAGGSGAACAAEDATIRRWRGKFFDKIAAAAGNLVELRASGGRWLAEAMKIICNGGEKHTRNACPLQGVAVYD
jgi:hypothetical protein